jgi:hypothetical protein
MGKFIRLYLLVESEISNNKETQDLHTESLEILKILAHLRKTIGGK